MNRNGDDVMQPEILTYEDLIFADDKKRVILNVIIIDESAFDTPVFDKEKMLWKVVLRRQPQTGYFIESLKHRNIRSAEEKANKNGRDWGHLIAKWFKKYLLTEHDTIENKQLIDNFFGEANTNNTEAQSPDANRNTKGCGGQLDYEQRISNILDKPTNIDYVYYEIQVIYDLNGELKGRRIYYKKYASNLTDTEAPVHEFIPEKIDLNAL